MKNSLQSFAFRSNSQNIVFLWRMEKLTFPLLCFQLNENAVLGLLVGTSYQIVETTPSKVKAALSDHLAKIYKKDGDYPLLELEEPSLRLLETNLRPTYRFSSSAFPLSSKIKITVPLVYGETEPGVYECFLPLLDESFYCYEFGQMDSLARHFISNALDEKSPEEIYRLASYPSPTLEIVTLKIKDDVHFTYTWNVVQSPKVLERLAERYPYPKAIQRNLAAAPDAAWELDTYVAQVVEKLMQQRASVLVVGDNGVGKSAVLRQAFRKLGSFSKKSEAEQSFWRIQAQRFTSSSKYLGEWQETAEELVWELGVMNGILWVEDIARLLREGGKGVEDSVAAYLLPFIQQGKLQVVGEVTPQELESMRRLLPGFVESLQIVELPELPERSLSVVLEKFNAHVLQAHKININTEALATSTRLLRRFYPYESFPGKSIRFLGECVSEAIFQRKNEVSKADVLAQFIRRTGLPELFLRDDLLMDQVALGKFFNEKIIGQEAATEKLTDVIKVFKAGLNNPQKPITTLVFAGPTGVGKTAAAQTLAQYFFGLGQKSSPLIRIDMSEYQHPSQITRFLGTGKEPGRLVQQVRERPFAVLLLDEAEKATPAIFDAFLTVLDEGMLVDAFGRVTNFRNCIIILTTNLGASNRASIGYGSRLPDDETYRSAIGAFFRPEFVNRIDHVVVFQPLSRESITLIAKKELDEVKSREGFAKRRLSIEFSERAVGYIIAVGFHEKYGARPLQRAIEDYFVKNIAKWLLENPAVTDTTLRIDVDETSQVIVFRDES
ncbi:MAG: AAA domain-containing protein [Bacteroidetes bacterium]|nr:AAA domain-containing protein [Bacteroidota bacterium]